MELPANREMVWAEDTAYLSCRKCGNGTECAKLLLHYMVVLLLQRFIYFKKGLPKNERGLGKEMLSPPLFLLNWVAYFGKAEAKRWQKVLELLYKRGRG